MGRMVGIGVNQLVYAYPDSYIFHADCAKVDGAHTCITPGEQKMPTIVFGKRGFVKSKCANILCDVEEEPRT